MKYCDRAVVTFSFCSLAVENVWYAGHLRAVPIYTKKSREVLPQSNPQQNEVGVIP